MPASPTDALAPWHDFAVFIGTVSATLIGAMFVVASIGSGFLTRERAAEIGVFLTPTVIHLSTILLSCGLVMVPALDWGWFALLFGLAGLAGLVYSGRIGLHVGRRKLELSDRIWYAGVPILGYVAMAAAALMALAGTAASPDILALALALLVIAGLRNAWDLILFIVTQPKRPS